MLAALLVYLVDYLSRVILLLSTEYIVSLSDGLRRCKGLLSYFLVALLEYLLQAAGAPINANLRPLFVIGLEKTLGRRVILLF